MKKQEANKLAKEIVEALEYKGALESRLPMHLDRDKFLFFVRGDISKVLTADQGDDHGKD